jgi:hypothetical protein
MTRSRALLLALVLLSIPTAALGHAPSVSRDENTSPDAAVVLDDPTLSRAIGATIAAAGEVDWYRMELRAGDPLVVGMTAPDAAGTLPATFILLGPGLPEPALAGARAVELAALVGAPGAVVFEPAKEPTREVHAGLGFLDYGVVRLEARSDGTYWIAVSAVDAAATGKYVLAPGIREEFGVDAVGGMVDLVAFFAAPWPPETSGATPAGAPGHGAAPRSGCPAGAGHPASRAAAGGLARAAGR